jgi:hypothetical protein
MFNKFIGSSKQYNENTDSYTYSSWIFPICFSYTIAKSMMYSEITIRFFILEFSISLSDW